MSFAVEMIFGGGIQQEWAKAAIALIASSVVVVCQFGWDNTQFQVVMQRVAVPAASQYLAEEGMLLHTWAIERGANEGQARRIVSLLDLDLLRSLPLPPRTHRKPGTPDYLWGRFLFRRHIQAILKWTARREETDPTGFGEWLNGLIRNQLFQEPNTSGNGEDEGRSKGGRETTLTQGREAGLPNAQAHGDGGCVCDPTSGASGRSSGGGECDSNGSRAVPCHVEPCRCRGVPSLLGQPGQIGALVGESNAGGIHMGAHDSSTGHGVGNVCLAHRRHAPGITNVSGSTQHGSESKRASRGHKGSPDWPGAKRRRKSAASAGDAGQSSSSG